MLRWTDRKPTEDGLYWFRWSKHYPKILVYVCNAGKEYMRIERFGQYEVIRNEDLDWQLKELAKYNNGEYLPALFAGPIEIPEPDMDNELSKEGINGAVVK